MAEKIKEKYPGDRDHGLCYPKRLFGERITVSGLITAQDIMAQLKDKELGRPASYPVQYA